MKNEILQKNLPNKPKLTPEHARKRYEFSNRYLNYSTKQWEKVAFLDEFSVQLNKTYRIKGWKRRGAPLTKNLCHQIKPDYVIHYNKYFTYVTSKGQGELINAGSPFNSKRYIEILSFVLPKIKKILGKDFYNFHDHDTTHFSKKTIDFLKANGYKIMENPPILPEASIIENMFAILKKRIFNLKHKPNTLKELDLISRDIWKSIDISTIINLYNSLPVRMKLLNNNLGYQIKY